MILKGAELDRAVASPPSDVRLWLFFGADAGGAAELADRVARAAGGDRMELDAKLLKADPSRLAAEAASVSMFGDRLCLRVAADDGCVEAAALLLDAPGAEHPCVMTAGDLRPTSALRKLAEKHPRARAAFCYLPDARQFAGLAREMARAKGLDPDPAALAMLTAATAPERGVLAQELEKLALYLGTTPGKPKRLDPDAVAAVGAGEGAAEVDALIEALTMRDAKAVARALAALEAERASAITLVRAAGRRVAQLIEARAAVDAGSPPEEAAGALRPPLFWKAKPGFVTALKRWRSEELAAAQARLLAAERAVKSAGSAGEGLATHALLVLAGSNATPRAQTG